MTPQEYKTIRRSLGLTQQQLATMLGVTKRTVQSREAEGCKISDEAELAIKQLKDKHEQ